MATAISTEGSLDQLERRLSGKLIRPGDDRYDAARKIWNAMVDRRPAAIVRARTDADVAAAIAHAREHELELAVRSGGHSMSGLSMTEGGLALDLGELNRVRIDPERRRARVGGGALLMDVIQASQPHQLAMPFGHVSHTGVGGLTLGGGIGWLMRRDGLAIDALRSVRVVTAEGRVVNASADENPELFWALRGGGGNFGVVTEFEFELRQFGPEVLAGMLLYPLDGAAEALRFCRDFMDQAPEALTVYESFMTVPPQEPFPTELWGRPALSIGLVYAGPVTEGEGAVAELRGHRRPALDLVQPMPPVAVQTMLDETAPHGMRDYSRSHWLSGLPEDAIETLVSRHAQVTSPMSLIITARMGGAIERVPADETAFGHRAANRLLWAVSCWWEGDDAEHIEWCRGVHEAMAPYSDGGVYVNALGDEGPERVRAGYEERVWNRLVEAKQAWDPGNVFRLNQNIPPS